jgi:hypothetical protein
MVYKAVGDEQRQAHRQVYDGFVQALKKAGFINVGTESAGRTSTFDLPEWGVKWRKDTDDYSIYFHLKSTVTRDVKKRDDEFETFTIGLDYSSKLADRGVSIEDAVERKRHRGIAAEFKVDDVKTTISQMTMALMEFYGRSLVDCEKIEQDFKDYTLE